VMQVQSLRARLIVIILTPLLLVAIAAAGWQFVNTSERAGSIFDRGLLSAALAISRDVAISGGDALSPSTRSLISDTSGGEVFYHVYAPDGVFVTGYATPPPPPTDTPLRLSEPLYYTAIYQARDVRVLRFQDAATIDGVSGLFTISVWQDMRVRASFVREVVTRTIAVLSLLLLSVGLIVWFGVGLGLRPLHDLQQAIAQRTPSDLDPIKRAVPAEVEGIVATLNALLERVSRRISSKDEFISNAAHQLRNPIAGVLALAEAVENAPNPEAAKTRSKELARAGRDAARLTNQLLSFERARGTDVSKSGSNLDLRNLAETVIARFRAEHSARLQDVSVEMAPHETMPLVWGDDVMLGEALLNLLTNAVVHGGTELTRIRVSLAPLEQSITIDVEDDGRGISPQDASLVLGRFVQANAGPGNGLGLPIARQVIENHGGTLEVLPLTQSTCLRITLPVTRADPAPQSAS